jgi:release factor glutamine methyltransferase
MRKTMQTFHELLTEGTQLLVSAGIEEARLDAWLLLEYTADIGRAWYYAHPETEAGEKTALKYLELCKQRAEHIPLQHLTHQACFMGYDFYVDERVLVPRQDTEVLAEEALDRLKEIPNPKILDMCTGSGCLRASY